MTVEQNVLQHHSQRYQQVLLNQLRDATGTTDTQRLQQALQASNGDLAKAVTLLMANSARVPVQNESVYYLTPQTAVANNSSFDASSQAGTSDDKDDLQRALTLSLEESSRTFRENGISDEEQAISRILEASIAENKQSYGEAWRDSLNPYDRKRQDTCPVGLKNVGNTCWFSAVIQSLFNLLEFQKLVLLYSPPERCPDLPSNHLERHNVLFMVELRRLFALMLGSNRKYVDPSRALEILNDAFKSSDAQQQDVSEFTHKLLEWLEDAFKTEEEREGQKLKNPLVELFYGQFLAVGVLEGKKFENTEMFGQYPLQVNGFNNLHECLEAATIEGEIESLHSGYPGKSGQERWFTKLPPVLTFELSRFEFNQAMGRPEKIHNKLEFPSVLYMDRYMYRNREITQLKRDEIRRLREHLTFLQQQLERYLNYGSGPKRLPLCSVLQYAMEFASSRPAFPSLGEDSHIAAPPSGSFMPLQPSPSSSYQATTPLPQPHAHSQPRASSDMPTSPAPRHVTTEEMQVLEGCLRRWRSEVETDIQDLQQHVARLHATIERANTDKTMMQVPYRLHAVLVHEGQASSGHYWAYIYSPQHRCWMRYNDITVTTSSWEELTHESYGGDRNASAYCLMYVSAKTPLLPQEVDEDVGEEQRILDRLPPDLRACVMEDNQLFQKELEDWDTAHYQAANQGAAVARPKPASTEPSTAQSTVPQQEPDWTEQPPSMGELKLWREDTERALTQAAAQNQGRSPEAVLCAAIKVEYTRLVHVALQDQAPESDHRLRHPIVYFLQNQAPKKVWERMLFEQFADSSLGSDERCKAAVKVAHQKLDLIKTDEAEMAEYELWHRDYQKFLEVTVFLLIGVELFRKKSYAEALVYLVYSSQCNKELLLRGPARGHSQELLANYRRACLLKLNTRAAALFEAGSKAAVSEGLEILMELVVPCMPFLLASDAADGTQEADLAAVETVRNCWCSYLDQEMEPPILEKLTEFLPKLLDCCGETRSFCPPPRLPSCSTQELCERFRRVVTSQKHTPSNGT